MVTRQRDEIGGDERCLAALAGGDFWGSGRFIYQCCQGVPEKSTQLSHTGDSYDSPEVCGRLILTARFLKHTTKRDFAFTAC